MTMNFKTLTFAAALVAAGVLGAEASTISAVSATPGDSSLFGTALPSGSSWATSPAIVSGNKGSVYASPFGNDPAEYYTVGSPKLVPSPAVLNVDATNSFELLWGTIDSYNAIVFSDGKSSFTVSGADLGFGTGGSVGAVVDITTDFAFTTVSFYSNYGRQGADQAAFEFALRTPAPVPVPAAGLLLVGGLGALGALRRRKAA